MKNPRYKSLVIVLFINCYVDYHVIMGKNGTDQVVPGKPSALCMISELAKENSMEVSNNSLMHRSNGLKRSKA